MQIMSALLVSADILFPTAMKQRVSVGVWDVVGGVFAYLLCQQKHVGKLHGLINSRLVI